MCVIPYGTQQGEVSFCAYNTGVGWRQIVENMHMVVTTQDWFQERGRHRIYAGGRPIQMPHFMKKKLPIVAVEEGGGNGRAAPAEAGCGSGRTH